MNNITEQDIIAIMSLIGKGTPADWDRAFSTVAYNNSLNKDDLIAAYDQYSSSHMAASGYDF